MNLKEVQGPECPRCGCRDASQVRQVSRWGQPAQRLRCRHCGYLWTVRTVEEAQDADPAPAKGTRPDVLAKDGGLCVQYHLVRCPGCGGEKCRVYRTLRPVRYHKCGDCGLSFKSVEKSG